MNKLIQFLKQVGSFTKNSDDADSKQVFQILDSSHLSTVMNANLGDYQQEQQAFLMREQDLVLLLNQFDWSTDFNTSFQIIKDAKSLFSRRQKPQYVSYASMLLNQLNAVVYNNVAENLSRSVAIQLDNLISRYQIVKGSQHMKIQWLKHQGLDRLTSKVKAMMTHNHPYLNDRQANKLLTKYKKAVAEFKTLDADTIVKTFLSDSPEVAMYRYLFATWDLHPIQPLEQRLSDYCTRHFTGTNLKADLMRWYVSIRFYYWWSGLAYTNYNANKDVLIDTVRKQLTMLKKLYPQELTDWYVLDQYPYLEFIARQDEPDIAVVIDRMLFILPKITLYELYPKQMQMLLGKIAQKVNAITAKYE